MSNRNNAISTRMEALKRDYILSLDKARETLSGYLRILRSAQFDIQQKSELRRLAHKLCGSAGSYGYSAISESARTLEQRLDAAADGDDDLAILSALAGLIEDVRAAAEEKVVRSTHLSEAPPISVVTPARRSKVLIAEDDPVVANLLKSLLESETDIEIIDDGASVVGAAQTMKPDLILLDDDLPGVKGVDLVKALQARDDLRAIPIVMLTGNNDPRTVMRAIKAGAADYFTKPFEPISFINHIRALLSRMEYTVLIVDDDAAIRALLGHRYEALGIKVIEAENGIIALDIIKEQKPHLVILDRMMPGLEGGAVLHELQSQNDLKNIPVIMLTARSNASDAVEWMRRGAVDFISKPFNPDEVVLRSLRIMQIDDDV